MNCSITAQDVNDCTIRDNVRTIAEIIDIYRGDEKVARRDGKSKINLPVWFALDVIRSVQVAQHNHLHKPEL